MKDEIKEIREYISCPQFGDDHYGKWGALRLDQRKKIKDLLDYITNLQEENKNRISESLAYDLANARIKELQEERKTLYKYTPEKGFRLVGDDNEK